MYFPLESMRIRASVSVGLSGTVLWMLVYGSDEE